MGVVSSLVGGLLNAVFNGAGQWAAAGAVWLLAQVGQVLSATTSIDLGAQWFSSHETVMAAVSAAVVLPMACCAAILAVYRQDVSLLVRSFLVKLPLALLFGALSVELVRLGLAVTDQLSGTVLAAGGVSTDHLLAPVAGFLTVTAPTGVVPAFVVFVGALLVAMGALALWMELVVRAAAVAAATLFLPLALAGLVWPAVSHWCRRLADTIAALVLSKLVVAAVLSLGASALSAGALGQAGGGAAGNFAAVVVGIALLLVATTAPFVLLRLVPAIEAGAVLHLETARHRLQSAVTTPLSMGRGLAMDMAGAAGMLSNGPAPGDGAGGSGSSKLRGLIPGSDPGEFNREVDALWDRASRGPQADASVDDGENESVGGGDSVSVSGGVSPADRAGAQGVP